MIDLYNKTIKSVATNRFEVELLMGPKHNYYIRYKINYIRDESEYSEAISDLNMAMYLFDLKIQELEGQ